MRYTIKQTAPDGLHQYGRTGTKAECLAAKADQDAYYARVIAKYQDMGLGEGAAVRRLRASRCEVVSVTEMRTNPAPVWRPGPSGRLVRPHPAQ